MKSAIKYSINVFIAFSCVLSNTILSGQSVPMKEVKKIAQNQLFIINSLNKKEQPISPDVKPRELSLYDVAVDSSLMDTLYYVFNVSGDNGFIIVAADKNVHPVLGYSLQGNFSKSDQPPAFSQWMENRKQEISFIKSKNIQPDKKLSAIWNNLIEANSVIESASISPLLQTTWNQKCYYNAYCPADPDGPCDRCLAGCVATATAQIMKYWNYPATGIGSFSYVHATYGKLSANFGATVYQWDQMPKKVTGSNDAVATLIYHCGVSVRMDYGPSGSSASDPRNALVYYFKYSSNAKHIKKSGYSNSAWESMLIDELNSLHPIWYSGDGTGGHAFVCDGYQNSNYFHFNWGWGGHYDGYFYLGSLNPGEYNFTNTQDAIIKIFPDSPPSDATTIKGPVSVCQGQNSVTYSVPLISGASSYIWTLPAGANGTSNSDNILVNFSPTAQSGSIKVKGHNNIGDGEESSLNINVNSLPSQPGPITGATSTCQGDSKTYGVTYVAGVKYNWSFPRGWTQTAGGTANAVTVTVGSGSGSISVTPSNGCGNGTARFLAVVTSTAVPAQSGQISGETSVCQGELKTYSVPNVAGVTYNWSFPAGWTQTSGGTKNSVAVITGSGSGNITVIPLNSCGNGIAMALAVTSTSKPAQPGLITGATNVCLWETQKYSVVNVAGVIYNWEFPTGWIQTEGGTTNSVTVKVGSGIGKIVVTPYNNCGKGTASVINISDIEINYSELYDHIYVYPNPVTNDLNLEIRGFNSPCNLHIINQFGQTIYSSEIENKSVVKTAGIPDGIYIIKFEIDKHFLFKKFIKK